MKTRPQKSSLVVERLRPWIGRRITIRLTWDVQPAIVRLVQVLPIGREYFIELDDASGSRLVNVGTVLEIAEALS